MTHRLEMLRSDEPEVWVTRECLKDAHNDIARTN